MTRGQKTAFLKRQILISQDIRSLTQTWKWMNLQIMNNASEAHSRSFLSYLVEPCPNIIVTVQVLHTSLVYKSLISVRTMPLQHTVGFVKHAQVAEMFNI